MSAKTQALASGLTFHLPSSGALAVAYGLVESTSGWHGVAVTLEGNTLWLLPRNGWERVRLGSVTKAGRLAAKVVDPDKLESRQVAAKAALALAALGWYLNKGDKPSGLTVEGWATCQACGRPMQAGQSLVNGMGPVCRNKGKTTDREAKRQAGLAAMQAKIDEGAR